MKSEYENGSIFSFSVLDKVPMFELNESLTELDEICINDLKSPMEKLELPKFPI